MIACLRRHSRSRALSRIVSVLAPALAITTAVLGLTASTAYAEPQGGLPNLPPDAPSSAPPAATPPPATPPPPAPANPNVAIDPTPMPPPYSTNGQTYGGPVYGQPPPHAGESDDESHYYAPRPPEFEYQEPPPPPVHAPKFSLWAGARLSFLAYDGRFYTNQLGQDETTGNFVKNGLALEGNVGVRLGKHYIPYIFYEYGFIGAGHRFDGEDASAHSGFYGVGFRYLAGDVNNVSFLTDLSLGVRSVTVSSSGQTYTMSSFELFRIGIGADIRLTSQFTLAPLISISGGAMSDTDGNVGFGKSGDGLTHPTYFNGAPIGNQTNYWVLAIGCGAHFDLFGK